MEDVIMEEKKVEPVKGKKKKKTQADDDFPLTLKSIS